MPNEAFSQPNPFPNPSQPNQGNAGGPGGRGGQSTAIRITGMWKQDRKNPDGSVRMRQDGRGPEKYLSGRTRAEGGDILIPAGSNMVVYFEYVHEQGSNRPQFNLVAYPPDPDYQGRAIPSQPPPQQVQQAQQGALQGAPYQAPQQAPYQAQGAPMQSTYVDPTQAAQQAAQAQNMGQGNTDPRTKTGNPAVAPDVDDDIPF